MEGETAVGGDDVDGEDEFVGEFGRVAEMKLGNRATLIYSCFCYN